MTRPNIFLMTHRGSGVKRSWRLALGLFFLLPGVFLAPIRRGRAAEVPAGLEAGSLGVRAALDNPLGLDVRDAAARPVSARLIESQIKAAQAQVAERGTYASSLPRARILAEFFEFLPPLRLAFKGGLPRRFSRAAVFSVAPKPGPKLKPDALASIGPSARAAPAVFCLQSSGLCPVIPPIAPLRC
ncbi:MAG: hypothetical protein ACYCPQ_10735 [Elusimicrobiota bacterium]